MESEVNDVLTMVMITDGKRFELGDSEAEDLIVQQR